MMRSKAPDRLHISSTETQQRMTKEHPERRLVHNVNLGRNNESGIHVGGQSQAPAYMHIDSYVLALVYLICLSSSSVHLGIFLRLLGIFMSSLLIFPRFRVFCDFFQKLILPLEREAMWLVGLHHRREAELS